MNSGKTLVNVLLVLIVLIILGTVGAVLIVDQIQAKKLESKKESSYGVFIGLDADNVKKMDEYRTVVIDAQEFTADQITALKEAGKTVYSYINVGSIENWRSYYDSYKHLTIGGYENWEDEEWVNVTEYEWQNFIRALVQELCAKGVDGFFVDNCDIYYYCVEGKGKNLGLDTGAIRDSLISMLKSMRQEGKKVIVNGGDTFVTYCIKNVDNLSEIFNAVNQETVITSIDFENKTFGLSKETAYFKNYLSKCKEAGLKVYVLEYAYDSLIIDQINEFCDANGYICYISNSIELN